MNAAEFIAKWRRVELRERQACQEHFLDLCELVGHPKPAADDPRGERFCFERGATKLGGEDGWADVWKKGYFGWEYKGKHKDLAAVYGQLNEYREALANPPLLVVCDMDRLEVHTNFTNTEPHVYELSLDDLGTPEGMRTLRAVFFDPESLRPTRQRIEITEKVASTIGELAQALRSRDVEPHAAARFLDRLVFCMFAEDVGLLPKDLFSSILASARQDPKRLRSMLTQLFDDAAVLDLLPNEIALLDATAKPDWSDVEPAIFGTLFERGLDPDKRSQIGAHFTSREDIETLVEPVVMQPLRHEWDEVRATVLNVLTTGKKHPPQPPLPPGEGRGEGASRRPRPLSPAALAKAHREADILLRNFLNRLTTVKVLDPACGSGNFLYVTLQKLMGLEREVLNFAAAHGIPSFIPGVDPLQLYGIEISPYAAELAQMTVWIGYLQALSRQGFHFPDNPVLKPMDTIQCRDAILDLTDPAHPREPEWPKVDYIVSNPPFLGDKLMRGGLGDDYVNKLRAFYTGRVPGGADLCCYWFEKARGHIEQRKCTRAGLLATQGIRGGANRKVLERIDETGGIFFAESDRPWVLDGANVHISMVGFDDGSDSTRTLNGAPEATIYPNLTAGVADLTRANVLRENRKVSFIGTTKKAPLDISEAEALSLLAAPNPTGLPNSDVVIPWINGDDVTTRPKHSWIIDFPVSMSEQQAAGYERPFEFVSSNVLPLRRNHREAVQRKFWWRLARPCPKPRLMISPLRRVAVTAVLAKHRLFVWYPMPTNPDHQLVVFARQDDYFFGVLHSRAHELWALRMGTRQETRPRYTPTTCFETFPFPRPPGKEPQDDPRVHAIAEAARELNDLRERWLNPPEWVREEVLEFPGSVNGPWARFVHDPDARGIGTVRWPRLVPRDADCAAKLKARTLTNLYNQHPTWLANAHEKLDAAVFAAYGWDPAISDEQLLASLLALNLQRAGSTSDPRSIGSRESSEAPRIRR